MQWSTSTNMFQFSFTGQVRLTPDTSHCWEANHWERPSQIRSRNEWKKNCETYSTGWEKYLFLCQWNIYSCLGLYKLLTFSIGYCDFHGLTLCSPFNTCFLPKLLLNEGKPRLLYWGDILLKAAPWIFHEGRCVPSSCLSMRILRGNSAFSDPYVWSLNISEGQMCVLSLVTLNKTLFTRFRVLQDDQVRQLYFIISLWKTQKWQ